LEWVLFKEAGFGAQIGLADYEHALSAHIKLLFFALYWHWENCAVESWIREKTKRQGQRYGNGRTVGFGIHSGALWIDLWNDPMEHRSKDPRWWHLHFDPIDFLFGGTKYESRNIKSERAVIPMPEGGYPCTVTINEDTWLRPRWPFVWKRLIRSEIKPDTPIAHPGKGENSWDCDEDAMHSIYGPYNNTLDAVMEAAKSVMHDRLRYGGGWSYIPEKLRAPRP